VRAKMRYVRDQKLGGVVIWEIGADDGRLMREIARGSRPASTDSR